MKTEIVRITNGDGELTRQEDEILRRAGEIIRGGGLVAFPTETVYGLGGDALNPESSRKIYAAKGRPSDNPLIVHISELEDLYRVASEVPEEAKKLAEAFWPGPVTMILRKSERIPDETTGGLPTVAVRFPSNEIAKRFIAYSGGFVAAPSVNISGRPSPTVAKYVIEDMDGKIDMIIDGGESEIGLESTIIDLTVTPPQILRPGFVTEEMMSRVLGEVDTDVTIFNNDSDKAPRAPGMKYRHYAPKGTLVVVEGAPERVVAYINEQTKEAAEQGEKTGVIGTRELLDSYRADCVKCVGGRGEEAEIARNLYTILRQFDEEQVTRIYSEGFAAEGLGQAIMNRLLKAAGHQVVHV